MKIRNKFGKLGEADPVVFSGNDDQLTLHGVWKASSFGVDIAYLTVADAQQIIKQLQAGIKACKKETRSV